MSGCESCSTCASPCGAQLPEAALPSDRPLVVWDGDCEFCRRWIRRLHALAGDRVALATINHAAAAYPSIPRTSFQAAIHLILPDGTHLSGAAAVARVMAIAGIRTWPDTLLRMPPARRVADLAYGWVARRRRTALTASRLLLGRIEAPSTLLLTRRMFLRLLGMIYLAAFLSIGHQILGLVGEQGLRPAAVMMQAAAPAGAWWSLPTLQWFGGDGLLTATWIIGAVAAVLLTLGVAPLLASLTSWAMYLSLVTVGSVFMQFQWDALLLECGLLAVLWCPATWRLNSPAARRPSRLVHWLLVLLLARLVFFGGLAKLQSGDPVWADCTALTFHLWTQPLPWWPAWLAVSLPDWILRAACLLMFVIELGCPLLLLLPRVPRTIGAASIAGLMLCIAATGNYGFFNWLTIVLCIAMLDDAVLLLLWPKAARGRIAVGLRAVNGRTVRWTRFVLASAIGVLVLASIWNQATHRAAWRPIAIAQAAAAPWHPVGYYGLFAVMTTTRPELGIEWQDEEGVWQPVVFKWKPGPLNRPGAFCQPGMPRLDWQMWFDAIGYERAIRERRVHDQSGALLVTGREVLPMLMRRLAVLDPVVLDLIETGPTKPPRAIRWTIDHYEFTTPEDRAETGDWWKRTRFFSSSPLAYRPAP
ncbi:MAG: lipase maturation factor family protein [Phycisphaerales bacterium]|jgi:predicted DCC family thiol-disulfide oxidoreductase YuxK|nr:lipase maturation factor family protein [Phycisphaerales bacterium]